MPQAVEVTLGTSGETLTLITTEAGGFTGDGEAFATGTDAIAQANGRAYTLTLDGTTQSAAYEMPAAMSLGPSTSGGMITIKRLEDGSYQANGSVIANGAVVTAENGNMYTVSISDDGMFSAEYVQPPALSIPLGTSGSSVEVRRNEDLTFSAMIDGEWMVITAETTVTAANGNVYAAQLSPEGIPIGVMHVAEMQEVMLGELGGTVTVTKAEDMTYSIGEMAVVNGTEYTAANGNVYVLMMDAEGMWSAMYQKVMVMVALGTQGSITLERAENMSWWVDSEAVDVGSEVTSDNGNTYTLWYADGAWSARFEPESMMIEGTGLTAMTREADDMYDVGNATLPASGVGDVTVDGAMYHVWMADGMLMGARFDAAIDADTDYKIGTIKLPTLSANDADTPGNELRTHLVVTGDEDAGMGMFSIGDLLGSGMASDEGANFVAEAVKSIEKVHADVSALLALDTKPGNLDTILESQWTKLEKALDNIFGTKSALTTGATSAVRQTAPREEDILDDIADILDALSSEAAFVAATAEDGGGVFESQALGAGGARDAFNRLKWTADATMGMTGSTRYGTAARKTSANAKKAAGDPSEYGAFSYSTMQQTVRTQDAAAVSLTGIASYMGGTHAVNTKGKVYTGMMELQVRFKANSVSGVVSGLQDSDGLAWQHNFADVDRIVLDDGTLRRNAKWTHTGTAGSNATVFYAANSGLLRPVTGITNTFDGILLGQGADAGSEANGTWSIGTSGGSGYLAGAFGVEHVADTARPVPSEDDGSGATAQLFTMATDANATVNMTSQSIADGTLTVKQRAYGFRDHDADNTVDYGWLAGTYADGTTAGQTAQDGTEDPDPTLITAKFDLAELKELGGGVHKVVNGATWVSQVISTLTAERDLLSTLQGLDSADTQTAEVAAWQRVQFALQYQMLGNLPIKMDDAYGDLESEADAIDLINRALDALSSNTNLGTALDPDGTGIFDHWESTPDDPATTDTNEQVISNFVNEAKEKVNGRTFAQMRGEKTQQVFATLGSTSYTRFGVWRRQSTQNSVRTGGVIRSHGGPGTFAYSPLDPTNAGTPTNTGFPQGGSATYTGETVALQNTTWLTGTVRVDVTWVADAGVDADSDPSTPETFAASLGTMSLTISDLASPTGDPLTYGGKPKATGPNLGTNPTATGNAGMEIADIVLGNFTIVAGAAGGNEGHLVVGTATAGTGNAAGTFTYSEVEQSSAGRLRFTALGMEDNTTVPATTGTSAKALFVGQGVDGPLGVIGTYTIATGDEITPGVGDNAVTDATASTSIGRLGADGTQSVDVGVTIYGAFGAQVP